MQSKSEAGEAPYREHIIIAPSWMLFANYYKEPVYAGYCEELKYRWKSNDILVVEFKEGKLMKKTYKFNNINIEYVNSHNKPIQPTPKTGG